MKEMKKLTIAELEALLQEKEGKVTIEPDGTVRELSKEEIDSRPKPKNMKLVDVACPTCGHKKEKWIEVK